MSNQAIRNFPKIIKRLFKRLGDPLQSTELWEEYFKLKQNEVKYSNLYILVMVTFCLVERIIEIKDADYYQPYYSTNL